MVHQIREKNRKLESIVMCTMPPKNGGPFNRPTNANPRRGQSLVLQRHRPFRLDHLSVREIQPVADLNREHS